jgi:methionine-S-sulfoxide reductase
MVSVSSLTRSWPLAAALLGAIAGGGCDHSTASRGLAQAMSEEKTETPPEKAEAPPATPEAGAEATKAEDSKTEVATLGAGCFWCIEAVLEQIDGVKAVLSGYMGGQVENPTYRQVCSGTTGHAEVVQVEFDPEKLGYPKLLDHFWKLHDPTTLNRQGNDVGTQYRSAIFYHSEKQREQAEASKRELEKSKLYISPIVTEITKAGKFYTAEDDHQDYYRLNKTAPYCRFVIAPKLDKLGLEK